MKRFHIFTLYLALISEKMYFAVELRQTPTALPWQGFCWYNQIELTLLIHKDPGCWFTFFASKFIKLTRMTLKPYQIGYKCILFTRTTRMGRKVLNTDHSTIHIYVWGTTGTHGLASDLEITRCTRKPNDTALVWVTLYDKSQFTSLCDWGSTRTRQYL